jgi:hypothetical protein
MKALIMNRKSIPATWPAGSLSPANQTTLQQTRPQPGPRGYIPLRRFEVSDWWIPITLAEHADKPRQGRSIPDWNLRMNPIPESSATRCSRLFVLDLRQRRELKDFGEAQPHQADSA